LTSHVGPCAIFEVLVGREDAARAKPHPDLYLEALRRLRLRPADAIAVEDSANGIRASVAAALRCIAMPNEVTKSHDFSAAQSVVTTQTLIHALALPDGRTV
jgi:beta-phosphoglucomutase-like phosphatase (HAD superfamily)